MAKQPIAHLLVTKCLVKQSHFQTCIMHAAYWYSTVKNSHSLKAESLRSGLELHCHLEMCFGAAALLHYPTKQVKR